MPKKVRVQLKIGDSLVQEISLTPEQVSSLLEFIRELIMENINEAKIGNFTHRILGKSTVREPVEPRSNDTIHLRFANGDEVFIKYDKRRVFFKPRSWSITTATKFSLTFDEVSDLYEKTKSIEDNKLHVVVKDWIETSLKSKKEWIANRLSSLPAVLCISSFLKYLRRNEDLRSLILRG